jgi:phosphatidylglycerol:prolipoprotein diacylglycerol transferase
VACGIAWILWRLGAPSTVQPRKNGNLGIGQAAGLQPGKVFAMYLILTGIARFLVEFIRINPRSFFGLSNAQAAGGFSALAGIALYLLLLKKQSHPVDA